MQVAVDAVRPSGDRGTAHPGHQRRTALLREDVRRQRVVRRRRAEHVLVEDETIGQAPADVGAPVQITPAVARQPAHVVLAQLAQQRVLHDAHAIGVAGEPVRLVRIEPFEMEAAQRATASQHAGRRACQRPAVQVPCADLQAWVVERARPKQRQCQRQQALRPATGGGAHERRLAAGQARLQPRHPLAVPVQEGVRPIAAPDDEEVRGVQPLRGEILAVGREAVVGQLAVDAPHERCRAVAVDDRVERREDVVVRCQEADGDSDRTAVAEDAPAARGAAAARGRPGRAFATGRRRPRCRGRPP